MCLDCQGLSLSKWRERERAGEWVTKTQRGAGEGAVAGEINSSEAFVMLMTMVLAFVALCVPVVCVGAASPTSLTH